MNRAPLNLAHGCGRAPRVDASATIAAAVASAQDRMVFGFQSVSAMRSDEQQTKREFGASPVGSVSFPKGLFKTDGRCVRRARGALKSAPATLVSSNAGARNRQIGNRAETRNAHGVATARIFKNVALGLMLLLVSMTTLVASSAAQSSKPNILVIMGDDIGYWNISAYNRGMMGYRTPNIDRIAAEGAIFTDYYGQQSCTAGRAAFITGQSPLRTGLLKVGLPAAKEGLSALDPTIAELLKPQDYATAQFGKNHLGDRSEFLPTVHGFDEFFGNLYHLNAEDEPEHLDYPKNPAFRAQFGPRGVLRCFATATDTPGDDPRFGPWGKQRCEDTGPLTKKRQETIDEEFLRASLDFIDRAHRDQKPFFVWFNPTRMHIWTRLKPSSQGATGVGLYPDGMVEHDQHVGRLLQKLDDLGIANNTIVVYTTDNGAETFSWPDGGTTPFRGEKNTNWEGGYRVPALIRWPGLVPPRSEINDLFSAEDWAATFLAAAGEPGIKAKLLTGYEAAGKTFRVHLDGYDQRDLLGHKGPSQRREFFYWTDDGNLAGLRYDQWKVVFMEQKAHGLAVWAEPMVQLRLPMLFNLRSDPFERAQHEAGDYVKWFVEHAFVVLPVQTVVAQHLASYQQFPPRQKPGSFSIEQVMEKLRNPPSSN